MPWRKILYEKQDYPDNFSGPEFLEGLKTNVTAVRYTVEESVVGGLVLAEEIALVILYALIFSLAIDNLLGWRWEVVLVGSVAVTVVGSLGVLALAITEGYQWDLAKAGEQARSVSVFLGFGYGFSPLIRTLTQTISTDTIYAMSAGMFLLALVFHDYGVDVSIVSTSFAINGRLFGAVCLVSRLDSSNAAFTHLALALTLFVLWPLLRLRLYRHYPHLRVVQRVMVVGGVLGGLWLRSPALGALFAVLLAFLLILCPYVLMRLQHMKSTIHGPWDEAVIEDIPDKLS